MPRPRLFRQLDALHRHGGALWVQGVPGGGKTTLLASWLEARRHPAVWLKLDEGDADLATFFHYLAAAARRGRRRPPPLPVLAPEHLEHPEVFARNFFRALHGALPRGAVLVLDDLQEAGGALHGVVRALLDERPPGAAVVLSSRAAPPARLARVRAAGELGVLGGSELDLTEREVRALAQLRGFRGDAGAVAAATGGWPAAVSLRLLEPRHPPAPSRGPEHELFTGEVLEQLAPRARLALLEAALLPPASAELVTRATGAPDAGALLASLAERGLFTVSHGSAPPVYEFHALFRAFLLARGERELSPERRAEVRRAAALALAAQPGAAPEAVLPLLVQAGAFEEAARLVAREAGPLLEEGRARTVEGWLEALPPPLRESDPWLLHWAGVAAIGRSATEARQRLERAFTLFEQAGDADGVWLSWAARVDAAVAAWSSFEPLQEALADLARLRDRFPLPGGDVEKRVVLAACLAATLAAPEHPDLPAWADAVREIASAPNHPVLRLVAGGELALLEGCLLGEPERSRALTGELSALAADRRVPEAVAQRWRCFEAPLEFAAGRLETCAALADRALVYADRLGLHLGDYFCRALRFQVALTRDEPVGERLRAMERALRRGTSVDAGNLRQAEAMAAFRRGDVAGAAAHAEAALALSLETRNPMGTHMALMLLVRIRVRSGDPDGARTALASVRAWAERARSGWARCVAAFLEAEVLVREERLADAAAPLAEGFRLVEEKGVHPFLILDLAEGARLCDAALAAGLDDGPIRRFVERWRLDPPPPADARAPELWPWQVRVRVLGPPQVERDGAAVGGSGRIPRKPLELLRLLASQGGREVDEHVATAALWPDADGDAAHHALETTVYRLRRLLGADAVIQRDRKLSLARHRCWVDAFELEERLGRLLSAQERGRGALDAAPGPGRDATRVRELYRGPLLADAEGVWARQPRERLRRKLSRWLDALPGPESGWREAASLRAELHRCDPDLRSAGAAAQRA